MMFNQTPIQKGTLIPTTPQYNSSPPTPPSRFLPASREMWCYNAVVADARVPSASDLQARCSILSPELALPSGSHANTTRSHGALHILGNHGNHLLSRLVNIK